MGLAHSPQIVTDGLVFAWDGTNPKCWDGSSSTHYDLVGRGTGTKTGENTLQRTDNHVSFSGVGTRTCYISFPSANITVPTGDTGTWMWVHYFSDAGNQDHPNIGKETTGTWSGTDGFVFGTGFGLDGPRWGVGGQSFGIYTTTGTTTGDYTNTAWQIYTVTYTRNNANGLKTYLFDANNKGLVDQRATTDVAIGSNSNALHIGATNVRGGNWNGYMDFAFMWNRDLTLTEIQQNFNALRGRYGL